MIASCYTYFNNTTSTWDVSVPAGVPADLFAQASSDLYLTSQGWVVGTNGAESYTMAADSDSSMLMTHMPDGSVRKATIASTSLAGKTLISSDALRGYTFNSSTATYPAGAVQYDLIWQNLSDSYVLWDSPWLTGINTLAQVATSGAMVGLDSGISGVAFIMKFVNGRSTVDIFRGNVIIGTAPYATTTISGQQILEVSIPNRLRDEYKLGDNPIFAVYNGTVHNGRHAAPGAAPSSSTTAWNNTAIQFLQSNLDTSKAAAPAATTKHANRIAFGR